MFNESLWVHVLGKTINLYQVKLHITHICYADFKMITSNGNWLQLLQHVFHLSQNILILLTNILMM